MEPPGAHGASRGSFKPREDGDQSWFNLEVIQSAPEWTKVQKILVRDRRSKKNPGSEIGPFRVGLSRPPHWTNFGPSLPGIRVRQTDSETRVVAFSARFISQGALVLCVTGLHPTR